MLRVVLLLFFFSMACMGQTFQYSRGWTNGKRSALNQNVGNGGAAGLSNFLHTKEDDGLPELFDMHDVSERRFERCLLQLQRLIRNPLLLHTAAASFAFNPPLFFPSTSSNGNGNSNNNINNNNYTPNNNNNSNNNINNPFVRTHQSNELFEELTSTGIIEGNDYGKPPH